MSERDRRLHLNCNTMYWYTHRKCMQIQPPTLHDMSRFQKAVLSWLSNSQKLMRACDNMFVRRSLRITVHVFLAEDVLQRRAGKPNVILYLCRELDIEICDESTSKVERRNNAPLQLKLLSDRFTKKNSVLMSAFSKVGCRQDVSRTNP